MVKLILQSLKYDTLCIKKVIELTLFFFFIQKVVFACGHYNKNYVIHYITQLKTTYSTKWRSNSNECLKGVQNNKCFVDS